MPARLDAYVEELRSELKDLPVTQRAEQLFEVRTHLDSLKSANLELGLTEEEAEAAAISQLGGPKTTGKTSWRDSWDTPPGIAFVFGFVAWLPGLLMLQKHHGRHSTVWPVDGYVWGGLSVLGLLIGLTLARLFRNALRGSLMAVALGIGSQQLFALIDQSGWRLSPFEIPRLLTLLGVMLGTVMFARRRRRLA